MHNAAFKDKGLPAYYLSLELDPVRFKKLLGQRKNLLLSGFNLTVPHKESVLKYLDTSSPEVKKVGACNTVIIRQGKWRGENTDIYGFLKGLEAKGFKARGREVAVLGSGGAARAVIYGLLSQKVKSLIIFNRTLKKAEDLVKIFSKQFPKALLGVATPTPRNFKALLPGKQLIVNTTSVGLSARDGSVIPGNVFPKAPKGALAYDLIYSADTKFLKAAKSRGWKVQSGKDMLLYQGARAWELWTGKRAPVKVMEKALLS
jgi:shikimate dehydrogenase